MADLNTLLRWAVENTPAPGEEAPAQDLGNGMTLKFKPAVPGQQASANAATLHTNDPQYPHSDLSPASTPGPATPANGAAPLPGSSNKISTEMLDLIMGKPDSLTMKEKMATASDTSLDVETRVEALDDFEMLVELIDNANNMAVLKLWEPLIALYDDKHPEVVRHALWITGTAVQNNLKAQAALFVHDAFPKIIDIIYPATREQATRAKAQYAMSSALKHWPLASAVLSAEGDKGYAVLRQGVADESAVLKRKFAFLLGTLVMQADETYEGEMPAEVRTLLEERAAAAGGKEENLVKALARTGVFASALAALAKGSDDLEYEENAVRALARAAATGGLTAEEKAQLKGIWEKWGAEGREERGFVGADGEEIAKDLA
ncbi:Hsp70 nucleotide exchange factor FES1 [Vanrija pseudolonga]|uniref:Hsp70 nucleotide exchange factor FES1 n=1 Tax=Vanrija pseudolonga TaxID=143232 RepID=A0AAF1BHD6_9TREE|nr:Hsp70 nucleotide exchange factor FES1 [Vanrija pseudolonga]